MYTLEQLGRMSGVGIKNADKTQWTDARTIQLDTTLPKEQRMEHYLGKIKDPYRFLCGDTGVKIEFTADAPSLQELLTRYCIRKKNEGRF